MTSKSSMRRAGLASPSVSASASVQHSPPLQHLTSESMISAFRIPFSSGFIVQYAVYTALHSSQAHLDIDLGRRKVFESNAGKPLEDSVLTFSQVNREETRLWLFCIEDRSPKMASSSRLENLHLHGLKITTHDQFSYEGLYPCSTICSAQRIPCPTCLRLGSESSPKVHSAWNIKTELVDSAPPTYPFAEHHSSATCYLPRLPLRQPLAFFLKAVRMRIINDICKTTCLSGNSARRFQDGILWGPSSPVSDWEDGWRQHDETRSLLFSYFEVTMHQSGIFVQPQTHVTNFLPFPSSSPPPPGTPITFLPYATPAYYLNVYSGNTSGLAKSFNSNFAGLGVEDFKPISEQTKRGSSGLENSNGNDTAQFVIAWVSVENKQGEEKGMIVIWPASLCLSLMSMPETADESDPKLLFAYNRKPLAYIPELPLALQASPVPAPATVPTQARAVSPYESLVSPSLFTPVGRRSFSRETTPSTPFQRFFTQATVEPFRPPLTRACHSFSTETAQAFQTLTISHLPSSEIRTVAESVGKFVDFMAKERERERDRIRKEKEAQSAAAQSVKGAAPSPQSPGAIPSTTSSGIVNVLQNGIVNDLVNPAPGALFMPSITVNTQTLVVPTQIEVQQPPIHSSHPSYPSPPEEAVKVEQTSTFENSAYPASVAPMGPTAQEDRSQAVSMENETYDSFGMDKFMMDLGIGMDFNMTSSGHQGGLGPGTAPIKDDFDSLGAVFTEDDFSFFDDPIVPPASTNGLADLGADPLAATMSNDAMIEALGIPSFGSDSSAPNPAQSLTALGHSTPWISSKSSSGFDAKEGGDSTAPELLPGSPGGSTSSSLGPATPEIISSMDLEAALSETQPFDALSFSKRFCSSDAKYAVGKFAKFTNSLKMNENEWITRVSPAPISVLWRIGYDSITDPRVDALRKLIGMKRRINAQGVRFGPPSPPFQETRSEWESCCADEEPSIQDVESERDSDEENEFQKFDDEDVDSISRPSTPLASHLPLGPTLLSTHFRHSLLLPLSINLRSPGASFARLDMASPLPNPVPTPVSPAAALGLASEKTKMLEVVVHALACEIVGNTLWAAAWQAVSLGQAPAWKQSRCEQEFSAFDVDHLLTGRDSLTIGTFTSLTSVDSTSDVSKQESPELVLKPLEQPLFTIGKADILVQLLPPALHFWSKMGLAPRSGPKDVTIFVLYEDSSRPLFEVENWLSRVGSIYNAKGYGTYSLGKSTLCTKDGFIPVRYTTFRKTLTLLVESLAGDSSPLLIFVVTPNSVLSLRSPGLRQIFTAINRVLSSRNADASTMTFHFIPDFLCCAKDDTAYSSQLEVLADNVYERMRRPIDRFMSRSIFEYGEKSRKYFEAPAFTLARTTPTTTSLSFSHPPPDLGCLDRHTLLHVGYRLTACGRWLVAAAIDQRGEGHDIRVWLVSDESDHKQIVSHAWRFAMEFARRANVEWSIAIAKLGAMDEAELGAWNALLADELSDDTHTPAMHVSVLCVDDESGWSVLPEDASLLPSPPSSKPPSTHESHLKNTGQLLLPSRPTYLLSSLRYPLPSTTSAKLASELGAHEHIAEDDETSSRAADRLLPLLTSVLITSPSSPGPPRAQYIHLLHALASPNTSLTKTAAETHEDICRNYHELAVLTCARWHMRLNGAAVPYHLAALRVVDETLELSELVPE